MATSFPVFVVLHPFRNGAIETAHVQVAQRLQALPAGALASVDGYYAASTDTALVALRFSRDAVALLGIAAIQELMAQSGLPLIIPDRLAPREKRRFLNKTLGACDIYVQHVADARPSAALFQAAVLDLAAQAEALECRPTSRPEAVFDIAAELPLFRVRAARPRLRRLDSEWTRH